METMKMDKLFDVKAMQDVVTAGFDAAMQYNETQKAAFEAQLAAAEKQTREAVQRAFDAIRETTRLVDQAARTGVEALRANA